MIGFETKIHEQELWSALKQGVMPHKLAYAGAAAITHCRLTREASYKHIAGSGQFEAKFATDLLKIEWPESPPINVCDIGPGNGIHTSSFLGCLLEKFSFHKYLGLDFSEFLLQIAAARIEAKHPALDITASCWDLDSGPCPLIADWRPSSERVFALLLGQTLGNLGAPEVALRNIHLSLAPGDLLLLSVALIAGRSADAMIAEYQNSAFHVAAVEPLLMAGLNLGDGRLQMFYDDTLPAVRGRYVFEQKAELEYDHQTLHFAVGDTIDCFISRRFTMESLTTLVSSAGFEITGALENETGDSAAMLLRIPRTGI